MGAVYAPTKGSSRHEYTTNPRLMVYVALIANYIGTDHMIEEKKRKFKPTVETKLAQADSNRVGELARKEGKTKSEVVREAVLWYLDHKEELQFRDREALIAKEIRGMTDRICAMLARQGDAIGTLYELTWMSLPNEDARLNSIRR